MAATNVASKAFGDPRTKSGKLKLNWCVVGQPAAKPPAVTKVAWAKLTMPPMPVTTTNDNMTIERAMPGRGWPRS